MEKILDINVTHPQEADAWVGKRSSTLRQALKSRFENNSNYSIALTNLSVSELWTER